MPAPGSTEGATMRRLVETIVRKLSDHPEQTRVVESFEGQSSVYEIAVPETDRGRLIGREGRTVRALRAFVGAAAAARGKHVVVRVRD
jgi:predicted RNA-binding protein YlqC (UPF0109 family)